MMSPHVRPTRQLWMKTQHPHTLVWTLRLMWMMSAMLRLMLMMPLLMMPLCLSFSPSARSTKLM
eukprot:4967613-Amphidinium_carterae.1